MLHFQFFKVLTILVLVVARGDSSSLRHPSAQLIHLENSTGITNPSSINNLYAEVPNVTTVALFSDGESNVTAAYQEQYEIVHYFGNKITFAVSALPIIIILIILAMAKLSGRGYLFRPAHEHHRSMTASETLSQSTANSCNSSTQLCRSKLNNMNNASKKPGGSSKANRLAQLDRNTIIRNNLQLAANRRMGHHLTEDDFSSSDDEPCVITHNPFRPEYAYAAVGAHLPENMQREVDNYNRHHQIRYSLQTSKFQDNDAAQPLNKSILEHISEDD